MYFTNTPSLNSMEAIMQRPPGGNQRGGGRIRRAYQFNKADCDCRLCLYHRKKKGCSMEICPVLDARLTCGAASFYEAIHAAFADARHTPFQRRLSHLYDRKDDAPIIFQTDQHRQRFEAQKLYLRKPDHRSLAVLYLLTADHTLWSKTRTFRSWMRKISRSPSSSIPSRTSGRISPCCSDRPIRWRMPMCVRTLWYTPDRRCRMRSNRASSMDSITRRRRFWQTLRR